MVVFRRRWEPTSDFLSRFRIKADAVQNGFLRRVSEHNLVETHIPLRGMRRKPDWEPVWGSAISAGPRGHLPGETVGEFRRILPSRPGFLCTLHSVTVPSSSSWISFIISKIRSAPDRGCQKKVNLLGELVHGHGALAHIHQIGSQGPGSVSTRPGRTGRPHRPTGHSLHKTGPHGGNRHAGVRSGPWWPLPERLVAAAEFLVVLRLMVKYLFHLLSGHHLLHKAVDASQVLLLLDKYLPAPFPL